MTRFARAKGSKASNERIPEEATDWSSMKEALLQKQNDQKELQKRKEVEKEREEKYNSFLSEMNKSQNTSSEWAEFSDDEDVPTTKSPNQKKAANKKVKKAAKGESLSKQINKYCNEISPEIAEQYKQLKALLEEKLSKMNGKSDALCYFSREIILIW